ncbi:heme-degrading monooxygenase HmoA [Arthrobacter ulcerisalmonis]|nr:antibiotic biosynthesis monooxygenase family protein [Arthrobacter ulcerisalmonis]MDQ0662233.1 heme-degrading monooxygenase HmoA [Arthrobacter ulcerisalmonis]
MSFISTLEITVDPAAANLDAIFDLDLPNTAAFPGNQSTEVLQDTHNPGRLIVVSRWATQADLDAYTAWRQSPEGKTRVAEIITGPPSSRHFSIRNTYP